MPKTCPGSLAVLIAFLGQILAFTACSGSDSGSPAAAPAIGECPDLRGTWQSGDPYPVLTVEADGDHIELTGFRMTLDITQQNGCHFSATNIWSNGEMEGTEHTVGVLNPDGNWVSTQNRNVRFSAR